MRIIISPAKKMNMDTDTLPVLDLPWFLDRAEMLRDLLRTMSDGELQTLWKCSDEIARLNVERLRHMDLRRGLTPAVLAYEGIQYRYMAPGVFTDRQLAYIQTHLRILSGFYGLLRPFDGVTPYRLEMQARLKSWKGKDLYSFWGRDIADALFAETNCVVDLASREYSLCISRFLPPRARMVSCVFGERQNGKILEKGTLCKMARGEMVRFLAEEAVERPEGMRAFHRLGYRFSPEESGPDTYVFLKEPIHRGGEGEAEPCSLD